MHKRPIIHLAIALMIAAGAAGCGQTTGERAISGAGLGAAGGAAAGAVTGGSVGRGALIGGALGGAAGALTDEKDLNLGEPVWD